MHFVKPVGLQSGVLGEIRGYLGVFGGGGDTVAIGDVLQCDGLETPIVVVAGLHTSVLVHI